MALSEYRQPYLDTRANTNLVDMIRQGHIDVMNDLSLSHGEAAHAILASAEVVAQQLAEQGQYKDFAAIVAEQIKKYEDHVNPTTGHFQIRQGEAYVGNAMPKRMDYNGEPRAYWGLEVLTGNDSHPSLTTRFGAAAVNIRPGQPLVQPLHEHPVSQEVMFYYYDGAQREDDLRIITSEYPHDQMHQGNLDHHILENHGAHALLVQNGAPHGYDIQGQGTFYMADIKVPAFSDRRNHTVQADPKTRSSEGITSRCMYLPETTELVDPYGNPIRMSVINNPQERTHRMHPGVIYSVMPFAQDAVPSILYTNRNGNKPDRINSSLFAPGVVYLTGDEQGEMEFLASNPVLVVEHTIDPLIAEQSGYHMPY